MWPSGLWQWVALIFAVIAGIALMISAISAWRAKPHPVSHGTHKSSVAVAVGDPNAFAGFQFAPSKAPIFSFGSHRNLSWTIRFTVAIFLPDREFDLQQMPPIFVFMPGDMTKCVPGPIIRYKNGQMAGSLARGNSTVEQRASSEESVVYEVRPATLTIDQDTRRPIARYEIEGNTRSPNTTPAGVASTNFELSYMPSKVDGTVIPGVGALHRGLGKLQMPDDLRHLRLAYGLQYFPYRSSFGRYDRVAMNIGKLSPSAPGIRDDRECTWLMEPGSSYRVQGTLSRKWVAYVDSFRSFLIPATMAGFIGALIALFVARQ